MKWFRNTSYLWSFLVAVLLLFIGSQLIYVDHNYAEKTDKKSFPEEKTIFFTVKESQLSFRTSSLDYITDTLKLWEYDKDKNKVYLREESMLPNTNTPLLVIYDQTTSSYEKQENIVPISTFPFSLEDTGTSLQINQIEKDGKVYFQYRGKELSLEPGETYRLPYFEGYRLKMATIENHGLFKTSQFKVREKSDK